MKPVYPIKFLTILIVTLILIGINKNAADAADKQCWNLVDVKTEWKKRNADGEWIKVSPNGVKSHFSTDRSWQWIEYSDPLYPKGRLVVNAGWSPPPNQILLPRANGDVAQAHEQSHKQQKQKHGCHLILGTGPSLWV
ncbi:MAG: hypothetical protein HUN05_01175 [Desulfobacter sp.]|nr:MAG: hypothetical protein HUN05_01175 [Desulfobacter sp.]